MSTVALRKIQMAVAAIGVLVFAFGISGVTSGGLSALIGQPHHGTVNLAGGTSDPSQSDGPDGSRGRGATGGSGSGRR
jgi:hypothetical protein